MIINVAVTDNTKTIVDNTHGGNVGENLVTTLKFTFSTEWSKYMTRRVRILSPKKVLYSALEMDEGTTDQITLPHDVFDAKGQLFFQVVGASAEGEVFISALQFIYVSESLSEISGSTLSDYVDVLSSCQNAILGANTARDGAIAAATSCVNAIGTATSTAVELCEEQVVLASGHANDASASALLAANNILNGVSTHNTDNTSHPSLIEDIRTVEAIARGRATAYVFDTLAALNEWVAIPENAAQLVVGDNLYIRALNVKDRWWDGTQIQTLESEAPDLTNYYLKSQVDAMMPIIIGQAAYDALVAAGTVEAGRIYYVTGA